MVNTSFTTDADEGRAGAERAMILTYAPADARAGLAALLALDDTLGAILRTTRDPMVGQMRLTWWHGALTALDEAEVPAEPVLRALAEHVVPRVAGGELAEMIEAWEELLDRAPIDDGRLARFAAARGACLFAAAGVILGARSDEPVAEAGRGWALTDLARHVSDPAAAARASERARPDLSLATTHRWSRRARALGAMAHLARISPEADARRMTRALFHRLTGR